MFARPRFEGSMSKTTKAKLNFNTTRPLASGEGDRKEDLAEIKLPQSLDVTKWNVQLPCKIQYWINLNGKATGREETRSIRLSVESDFDRPFPQSHKIMISDPVSDMFFHYTCNLTPFTFQSMAVEQKWKFPQMAGDAFNETFRRFAFLIQQCGNGVARNPTNRGALLRINVETKVATLNFHEIINGYRSIDLLSLDFSESPWTSIKEDIGTFTSELLAEHEEIKFNLIQVMETISKYQPILLLQCNELYHPQTNSSGLNWIEAKQKLFNNNNTLLNDNKQDNEEADKEVPAMVHIKTMTIPVYDNSENDNTESIKPKELVFTFYLSKTSYNQICYSITITDPKDMFFHFTSVDITPEVFFKMTEGLKIKQTEIIRESVPTISRSSGTFKNTGLQADSKQWFGDVDGPRGVVGIIANDFMTGTINNPERYQTKLVIRKDPNQDRIPKSRNLFKTGGSLPSHHPPALKATLKFTERVMFQSRASLQIDFHETDLKDLQIYIQKKCRETKHQIVTTQAKLSALLKAANSKNMGLFALLDRPSRNTKFEIKPPPMIDQYHRFGYDGNRITNYQESESDEEGDKSPPPVSSPKLRLIPQREVARMGIPVQVPRKEVYHRNKKAQRSESKTHPWLEYSKNPETIKNGQDRARPTVF